MSNPEYLSGMLRVLILSELSRGPGYGYGIAKAIGRRSDNELSVRPESLYPVLHRMETEKLVTVDWQRAPNGRPRKVYTLTPKGTKSWHKASKQFVMLTKGALKAIFSDTAGETA
jgi:DNA-binding PadR family transcriptional regulator